MQLAFGIRFNDLYEREGLLRVDAAFLAFLRRSRRGAARPAGRRRGNVAQLGKARSPTCWSRSRRTSRTSSRRLFGIEAEARALAARHNELAPLYSVKRLFVQRRALHKVKPEDARPDGFDVLHRARLRAAGHRVAARTRRRTQAKLEGAARYAAWAATTPEGKAKHRAGVLFKAPRKLDFMKLVPVHTETAQGFAEHTLDASAAARRLRAHRPRHRPRRRARRGQLLHLVPRAGQGLLLEGPEGEGARRGRSRRPCSACRSPAARSRRRSPSSRW